MFSVNKQFIKKDGSFFGILSGDLWTTAKKTTTTMKMPNSWPDRCVPQKKGRRQVNQNTTWIHFPAAHTRQISKSSEIHYPAYQ